jgi:hypothetical protein
MTGDRRLMLICVFVAVLALAIVFVIGRVPA